MHPAVARLRLSACRLRDFFQRTLALVAVGLAADAPAAPAATFGVFRSVDGGRTWTAAGAGLPADLRTDALGRSGPRRLAGTERGVYVSDDDGLTWSRPARGVPETLKVFDFVVTAGQVHAATARWIEPGAEQPLRLVALDGTLFAGRNPGGVFTSADGGRTWSETSAGLAPHAPTWALAATDRAVLLATTGTATVMRFERGAKSWQASDAGLPPAATAIAFGTGAPALLVAVIFRG